MRAIQQDQYTYSFWWLVPDAWMWHAYGLSMAVLLLFTVGLWTRLTSILSFVVVVSFAHRVPEAMFGLDQINGMLTLVPGHRPQRRRRFRSTACSPCWRRGSACASTRSQCRSQPGPATDQRAHVRHLLLRRHLQAARRVVVDRRGNVAGASSNLEYQSIDMTWLAGSPLGLESPDSRLASCGRSRFAP